MTCLAVPALLGLLMQAAVQQALPPSPVDPALGALVERFFQAQQAEDIEGYLRLWSMKASRPTAAQLKFIFDAGDDTFLDITVSRSVIAGDSARVRVSATRVRTDLRSKNPDGSPRLFSTPLQLALSLVRENGEWKIVREGAPADELAAALIDTTDPAARRALLDADPELRNMRLIEALGRRADDVAQKSEYRRAQMIYERALEVAVAMGDRKSEGQALQNIANSLYFQRDFPAALAAYERRLSLEREVGSDDGIATALVGIATVRYSTYEYSAALPLYREALAIQERLEDDVQVATTLISTGNVQYLQGEFDGAIQDYRRAEALKRKVFDLGGAASALEGLGRVYSAQGDYAAALGAFAGVLDERRRRSDLPGQALVLQGIGDVHFRLGNTDQARASFDEARRHFESVKDVGNAGRVLQGAALNELVAGRFAAGEKAYIESITRCTSAADAECIARAQVGLAFALAAQQKFDDAIGWYRTSVASFGELKMEDAAARARVGLAEALFGKAEYVKAFDEAVHARRTAIGLGSDDLLWRALVSQARAVRKLGRPVEALGTARAALLAVQRLTAAAMARPAQGVPDGTTAAYATVAVLQAEAGDGEGAFATIEQMRAHALWASLAPHERDITRGMTDAERTEERALASELTTLVVRQARQKALPKPDAAEIERLGTAIAGAAARRADARERLFGRLPDLPMWRGLAPGATVEDLGRLVDVVEGRVVLEFVVDEHDLVVLAASRPEASQALRVVAHVTGIERQALAERIGRALDGKALSDGAAWRAASAELFALIPSPISDRLSAATSVVIIPDDLLWRVPFEAMPVGTGYLADRAGVTYSASVASAAGAPRPGDRDVSAPGRLLAVTAPQIGPSVVAMLKATAPAWVLRPAEMSLAETGQLTAGLEEPVPVVLSGAAATPAAMRAALPSAGAIHMAAPFRLNSASPLFSPIVLAGAAREDSLFEARELFNLSTPATSVMFSDPGSLSMRDAAAAVVPLEWAWRAAGVRTMIVRRWAGPEDAAGEVVARFHEGLRAGKAPAAAFEAARAAVRATAEGRAPAAWAGWLIVGR